MRTARRRSAFQLMSLVDLLMLVTFAQLAGSRQAVEESRARQQAEVAALAETVRTVTADRDRTAGTLLDAEARRTAAELVARQAAERLERAERTRDAARAEAESAATLAAERQERLTAVAALVGQSAGYLERSSRELAELSNLVDRWWVELDAGGRPTVRTDGETATLRPFRRSPTEEAEELAALPPVERARRGAEFAAAAALDLQAQLEEFSRGSARPDRDTLIFLGWTDRTPVHWTQPAWDGLRRAATAIESARNEAEPADRIQVIPIQVGTLAPDDP